MVSISVLLLIYSLTKTISAEAPITKAPLLQPRVPIPSVDIGDADTLVPTSSMTPGLPTTLPGKHIVIEADSTGNYNVFLSTDVQEAVEEAAKNECTVDKAADHCQNAVLGALRDDSVDLHTRQIGALLKIGAALVAVVNIVLVSWYADHQKVPSIVVLSPGIVSQVTSAGNINPSGVVVIDKSGTATITPPPGPASATGSVPTIITYTAPVNGHAKNDVCVNMDIRLANRLEDFIRMNSRFQDRRKRSVGLAQDAFERFTAHGHLRRRQNTYNNVISGGVGIVNNAGAGGPFHDFALIQAPAFIFTNAEILAAANEVADYARQNAERINIPAVAAASIGFFAFAMSYYVNIGNHHLGIDNCFQASEVQAQSSMPSGFSSTGSQTSSVSSSSCPQAICDYKNCLGDTYTRTCEASGSLSNCPCTNQFTWGHGSPYDTSFGDFQASVFDGLQKKLAAEATPTCQSRHATTLWNGDAGSNPESWCFCKQKPDPFGSVYQTKGFYPIIPSVTGVDQCQYTQLPNSTISITKLGGSAGDSITSCQTRSFQLTSSAAHMPLNSNLNYSYCTCNDDAGFYNIKTTSQGTSTLYYCPDTAPTLAPPPPVYTKMIVLIWDVPPKTGRPFYDIFNLVISYRGNLDTQCGSRDPDALPGIQVDDPSASPTKVQSNPGGRPTQGYARLPPTSLDVDGCTYYEAQLGTASIVCGATSTISCGVPDATLANALSPNNGACGDVQNVRIPVMACPY